MFHHLLQTRLRAAVQSVLPEVDVTSVTVRPSSEARFGDYQATALIGFAKAARLNPRQLAADVVALLDVADTCEPVEVAGPGFLNFRLRPAVVAAALAAAGRGEHLFFHPVAAPRSVVIDFSSPNVAKAMHVGHIRSTGIGDALQRIFRLVGHRVITDNHIGDWGTQFGMLLHGWKTILDPAALGRDAIGELERTYKAVNRQCDQASPEFNPTTRDAARAELVKLQAGDPENLGIWREMIRLSQIQFDTVYARLGVRFDHALGESFYNPQLREVVADMLARGIARNSDGAVAIFSDHTLPPKADPFLVQRDGEWIDDPFLIQKSDGAANYATTDFATLQYRIATWRADEIIYVVGAPQQAHFNKLFTAFRRWQPEAAARVRLTHAWFGSILGEDGRPFKTRSGETVKLAELLDEAEVRALAIVAEKRPELPAAEQQAIARIVGLGAVKWQDLLPNRQSDYVFSWDKMLALQGNTAPYVQYQYTRAMKVVRDGGAAPAGAAADPVLTEPAELALTRHLLNFGLTLESVTDECRPNFLCNYLYELATLYSRFYESCPVLRADLPASVRATRLLLCLLAARVLRQGLECLGIEVSETM